MCVVTTQTALTLLLLHVPVGKHGVDNVTQVISTGHLIPGTKMHTVQAGPGKQTQRTSVHRSTDLVQDRSNLVSTYLL